MIDTSRTFAAQLNALKDEYSGLSRLRFSKELETSFEQYRRTEYFSNNQSLILLCSIVYLSLIATDIALLPADFAPYIILGRVALAVIIFLGYCACLILNMRWLENFGLLATATILFFASAHIALASFVLPQPYHLVYMVCITQICIIVPVLLKSHSRLCLLTMLFIFVLTGLVLMFANKPDVITNSSDINSLFHALPSAYLIFLAGVIAIGAYLSFSFERVMRKNWLDDQLAELKSQNQEQVSERLLKMSNEDPLTRIANRRHFKDVLASELQRAQRECHALSLLMLDLDHFKLYNDSYGHQAGDNCLRQVAQEIKRSCHRSTDMVARYGGEEFVVLLPNTDAHGAEFIAESIRQNINALCIAHRGSEAGLVTVSIGYTTTTENQQTSIDNLIHQADRALYHAKSNGRNQIAAFNASPTESSQNIIIT